jgi:hypothetical protein
MHSGIIIDSDNEVFQSSDRFIMAKDRHRLIKTLTANNLLRSLTLSCHTETKPFVTQAIAWYLPNFTQLNEI